MSHASTHVTLHSVVREHGGYRRDLKRYSETVYCHDCGDVMRITKLWLPTEMIEFGPVLQTTDSKI